MVHEFSERLERGLREAPRYVCDCCGHRTLLGEGYYEICDVCGWEDDREDKARIRDGADAPSGPNRISLTQARANYARFGASLERRKENTREPRPEEYV